MTQTWFYRHDEIQTSRPFAFDVDEDDWLWEGGKRDCLMGRHLRTAECVEIPVPEMGQRPLYQAFAWEGKLVFTLGQSPFYLVYDPRRRTCVRREVPAAKAIVWYGAKTPNGKLILFERSESKALILDGPDAAPRVVACPFEGQLSSGFPLDDGYLYASLSDPARVIRFDLKKERFVDENPAPFPEATLGGSSGHVHGRTLYLWDTAKGRFLTLDLETGKWLDPIRTPDHGKVYGFIGGGFGFKGKFYNCLSTYAHPSKLDTKTGKIPRPEGPLTVDGRMPPRFMERLLVFDPEARTFDYLAAPEQPDGVPLLCYSWTDGERFVITGTMIPFAEQGAPGDRIFGSWIALQSEEATEEPGFDLHDIGFDREAHLAKYRHRYGGSLYLPQPQHSPATLNVHGPAVDYPPGREAELLRRTAKTDSKRYLSHLAESLTQGAETDAERVKRILGYVQQTLYYNPIQITHSSDPVAILESHDARCGQGVTVTVALLEALGIPVKKTPLSHHVVAEATYDGGDHLADALFFGADQPHRDGRVLSVKELKEDLYFSDAFAQACFAYDPELVESKDRFWILGYVFGIWGSEPYYSYYLGAEKDHPPTFPLALPAQRAGKRSLRLNWARSLKMYGGEVEYDVRVFEDRACQKPVFQAVTKETSLIHDVEKENWMYFVEVRAVDDHRRKNPDTWYPAARSNFVLVPEEQYGWYGVL